MDNTDGKFTINLFDLDYIDSKKIEIYSKEFALGIKNYMLYQKFSNFRWPLWINDSLNKTSKSLSPNQPILLLNSTNRNCISLSNLHSTGKTKIDPTGMISPSYDNWSIEFWISRGRFLFRAQDRMKHVTQYRDSKTFIIVTNWEERDFELIEHVFCAINDSDDVIIELDCKYNRKEAASLLVVIRPYNSLFLGGIESVNYISETKRMRINDIDRVLIDQEPDFLLSSIGIKGDIDITSTRDNIDKEKCRFGMATLALGYNLHNGANELKMRLSQSKENETADGKINFKNLKKNYIQYTNFWMKNGFYLKFPEKCLEDWFFTSKMSVINSYDMDLSNATICSNFNMKSIYYFTSALNRMGYLSESSKTIDSILNDFILTDKADFLEFIGGCYLISSISDYFIHSRNIDYLKTKYKIIKNIALELYSRSFNLWGKDKGLNEERNSIENYFLHESHIYDMIIVSFSLNQFSYLSRCLGIFGDEIKFNKESTRLEELILDDLRYYFEKELDDNKLKRDDNEFFCYRVFAGLPFTVNSLKIEDLKVVIDRILENFKDTPIYFKSIGGSNLLFTIIVGLNLLLIKDSRVYDIVTTLIELGKESYALPQFINPKTGLCISGEGDSIEVLSAFFLLLRSILFIDFQDRLELLPVPKADWFSKGKEIIIEKAPSRFGYININIISTKDDIQFRFNEAPKFLPPNIMINLPFGVRIEQGEDFLVKKVIGNSYLINGWPTIIKFYKK
ncbi:MAG: hypothetical protein SVZ03_17000 [Spirochaetota bacterium]|nr:hypothetical protein [Spirochaetota bacterium]